MLLTLTSILLAGCSSDILDELVEPTTDYDGDHLVIGMLGDQPDAEFTNVRFEDVQVEDFSEHEDLDGLIINDEDLFQELSQPAYTDTFNEMKIPTFFIGLRKPYYLFLHEDQIYDETHENESFGLVQGFVFDADQNRLTWELKVGEDDYDSDATYTKIFDIIDQHEE
ncbi:hypothetical protein [Pelagirhabdus alkalitolerans]|uniref:hypothetical protein n=1 Tax=Pelagirhabdus alkalitolerans TaxID=1612202 RepID=UPI0015A44979|nr:hypothetical protein [Pelagirhabdus alkalitolerans]